MKHEYGLYKKFLSIDKRTRKNLLVGASLILMVVVTGFVLILAALVRFSGEFIDGKI